jgi:hypothetical protein
MLYYEAIFKSHEYRKDVCLYTADAASRAFRPVGNIAFFSVTPTKKQIRQDEF